MKKLLLAMLCMCGLGLTQAMATDAVNQPALTIYNQNFFVARERLPMELKMGANHVAYSGIAAHLEPDSVILRDPAGRALQILEQNYRNDPVSQELLLSFYEGKTIDFLVQRGDKQEIVKGKIVRSGYIPSTYYAQGYSQPGMGQPIIEIDGVLRFGLPGQPVFPALTGDSILKPTLSWLLETNEPGKFDAEISYVSGGMNWQADYNLVVSDKSNGKFDLLDMVGWVTMRNQSGKTFENASIKLLAGDVNKIQGGTVANRAYMAAAKAELVRDLKHGAVAVMPADEPLLEPHRRDDIETITFGPGGDVSLRSFEHRVATIDARGRKSINMPTTTRSRSGRIRITARSPIPRYG